MAAPLRPAAEVLVAFGTDDADLARLPGGRGLTWRAGSIVLRPVDDPEEANFRSDVFNDLVHTASFAAPRPIRAANGEWLVAGWEAWRYVAGAADESRLHEILRAGAAFHDAIAHIERPSFIDRRQNPWARADRSAWQEGPVPAEPTLDQLTSYLRPVAIPAQLIHGDLLGNVLFADPQPPIVIDWAPYWRPPLYASAVAVIDAVCWHGAGPEALHALGAGDPEWRQMLLRALIFRIATACFMGAWNDAMRSRHEAAIDAVVDLDESC